MSDGTRIEWTEATWNPVTGCSVLSPGCTNCYAMKLAGTRLRDHPSRAGLTRDSKAGPVWTGEVRFNEQWLDQPLRWRRPRMIFVCAHGDLFHEDVPDEWIDRVFAVMALCPQHSFQVLTKRSARMREYVSAIVDCFHASPEANEDRFVPIVGDLILSDHGEAQEAVERFNFPLPNVWLGVSVEDQARADERIPDLLATPAAVRWASNEPALGQVDYRRICLVPQQPGSHRAGIHIDALAGKYVESGMPYIGEWDIDEPYPTEALARSLSWVVAGGESGPGARPMHPDWARSLRDQCAAAGVPFFFKQWGEFHPADQLKTAEQIAAMGDMGTALRSGAAHSFEDQWTWKIGKKRAGRLLDGVTHDAMPVLSSAEGPERAR